MSAIFSVPSKSKGGKGESNFVYPIYRRDGSLPADPVGGSFNFTTGIGTPPAGWFNSPQNGTDPLYTSIAVASIVGNTGIDQHLSWTAPALLVQDGEQGDQGIQGIQGIQGVQGEDGLGV